MNVGGFCKRQNKTRDIDRYKRFFFSARVCQVYVNTVEKVFEQRSELRLAKCLIVHVLSNSYNVSSLELRSRKNATQHWSLGFVNDTLLRQIRSYHEVVFADNVVKRFWFVRSFGSQHYSKFIDNISPENVSQVRTKECKTRSFICKLYFMFLGCSRHSNFDTSFAVIVPFVNESVHGFSINRIEKVKTKFQIIQF